MREYTKKNDGTRYYYDFPGDLLFRHGLLFSLVFSPSGYHRWVVSIEYSI